MAELMVCWVMVRFLAEWEFDEVNDGLNIDRQTGERRSANSLTLPMEGGLPVRVGRRGRDADGKRRGKGKADVKGRRVEVEDEEDTGK